MASASSFIVVGAGVFGAATALELVQAGHSVTVLERSRDGFHGPDAASNDLNKIVRADYSDPFYRDLAKETISIWRRSPLLSRYYHETGVLFRTGHNNTEGDAYLDVGVTRANEAGSSMLERPHPGQTLKPSAYHVKSAEDAHRCFPQAVRSRLGACISKIGSRAADGQQAYFNARGGWAEADHATRAVLQEAIRLGAQVVSHAQVDEVLFDEHDKTHIVGVKTADGRRFFASGPQGHVILCAGAWTRALLKRIAPEQFDAWAPMVPTAQCVITVQLDEEQRKAYKDLPVVFNIETGFYCFEPDENGVVKAAFHCEGYQRPLPDPSLPSSYPTFSTQRDDDTIDESIMSTRAAPRVPADTPQRLLNELAQVYPEMGRLPIHSDRICFYSESEDENWIIDHLPRAKGLVVAGGDSGHAFKFLPILGQLVCARLGHSQVPRLTAYQDRVWSFAYHAELARQNERASTARAPAASSSSSIQPTLRGRL